MSKKWVKIISQALIALLVLTMLAGLLSGVWRFVRTPLFRVLSAGRLWSPGLRPHRTGSPGAG